MYCDADVVMVFVKARGCFFSIVQCRVGCVVPYVCFGVVRFDYVLFIFRCWRYRRCVMFVYY